MATFNEMQFEKKLNSLKDSQDSIQTLSNWCLQHRAFHKKIVSTWLRVLKKVKTEHRLTLFYLANDVIQYSKRKNYEFVESWGTALQRATTMVREEKVKHRILRIFKIWDERGIYDEAFIADLCGLLSTTTKKNVPENSNDPSDFQPSGLINKIRSCRKMEDDTDVKFKRVKDSHLSLSDADALRSHLKDRRQGDDVVAEVDEGVNKLQGYVKALETEIKERNELIELLEQAQVFYDTQKGEAKVVANAYRNFGTRVKNLKKRLDEMMPNLKDISPIPSPPNVEDAPSPSPDSDVDIPGLNPPNPDPVFVKSYVPPPVQPIRTVMEDLSQDKPNEGFSSFMGSALPFDVQKNLFSESSGGILSPSPEPVVEDPGGVSGGSGMSASEGKPIEVISSRTKLEESFNITDFLKSLIPSRTETIPGLTLDTGDDPSSSDLSKPSYNEPPEILSQPAPEYEYPPVTTSSTPLQPPPMPPSLFPLEDTTQYKYGQPSETEDSWNTKLPPKFPTWGETTNSGWETSEGSDKVSEWMPAMPVNKVTPVEIVDTPESPPMYEKEGFSDPVEYDDSVIEPTLIPTTTDVDHRTLVPLPLANHGIEETAIQEDHLEDTDHRLLMHIPPTNHVKKDVDHRPMVHRKKDVDHRNLISLTGSPMREPHAPLAPPPTPPTLPWPRGDQDYRSQAPRKMKDAPLKGDAMLTDDDVDYRVKGPKPKSSDELHDNVESVDMEMSDEEVIESSGTDGSSSLKAENSPIKNLLSDINGGKSTISFNISSPAKLLSNSPLNEIKEDLSRSRNRVYGCQRIPTIGGGTHSPRMMRFPPPGPPRLPFPNPRNLRPNLLAPPPPPPPLVSQFNSVRIRPLTELIQVSQNSDEITISKVDEKVAKSEPPVPGASEENLNETDSDNPWKSTSDSEPVGDCSSPISTGSVNATPPPPPPWNLNQEQSPSSPMAPGSDKDPQNALEGSDPSIPTKKWTPDKKESHETWMIDSVPEFEIHEVERLNSYDRGRGRGRGGAFNKNYSPMSNAPMSGSRGGFNHRGRPGWGPRRGGPQVPPPPPPPPPPRFPFRPPMDSFRGHRGGFRPPFRGNNPRHFGW